MTLTLRPLTPAFGAEIAGLDLARALAPETQDALYRAWLDHVVLLFRGQTLTEDDQRRFAAGFGTVGERSRPRDRRPEGAAYDGAFMLVGNIRDAAGRPIGSLPDGEMWFHHDMSYTPAPHKATVLYAIEVPTSGGNTLFADMYRAYDNVPRGLKERLAGRRALHLYDYATTGRLDPDEVDLSAIKHRWQPIFVTNPETGRAALYVNRLMTARIEGLARADSDAVLEELFAIAEDPALVYEHRWRPGDVLIWDNRCSTHARTDFPAGERRLLRRCTVEGAAMVPA